MKQGIYFMEEKVGKVLKQAKLHKKTKFYLSLYLTIGKKRNMKGSNQSKTKMQNYFPVTECNRV